MVKTQIIKYTVAAPTRNIVANWTMEDSVDYDKPYELTDEEKDGLTESEQETWKVLKTTEKIDIESEIASVLAEEIAKEMDAEILKGMLNGFSIK